MEDSNMAQDPIPSAAPANPAEGAAPPAAAVEPAKHKQMLALPESASDHDLIAARAQIVANLQQKYEALLQDTVALEDKVANRDVEDFKDVVPADAREFWKSQLLANRDAALAVLGGLRSARTAAPAKPADPPPAPSLSLKNRVADRPVSLTDLAEGGGLADPARAAKIRNRAHELRAAEKLPWSAAFARAEKELA